MRQKLGANYKSSCALHPSTPPKHPQAASTAVLQLHFWGSILYLFPSSTPLPEMQGPGSTRGSLLAQLKDNPHHWVVHHSAGWGGSKWQILWSLRRGRKEWDEQRSKWGGSEERSGKRRRAPVEFHRQVSTMSECEQETVICIQECTGALKTAAQSQYFPLALQSSIYRDMVTIFLLEPTVKESSSLSTRALVAIWIVDEHYTLTPKREGAPRPSRKEKQSQVVGPRGGVGFVPKSLWHVLTCMVALQVANTFHLKSPNYLLMTQKHYNIDFTAYFTSMYTDTLSDWGLQFIVIQFNYNTMEHE